MISLVYQPRGAKEVVGSELVDRPDDVGGDGQQPLAEDRIFIFAVLAVDPIGDHLLDGRDLGLEDHRCLGGVLKRLLAGYALQECLNILPCDVQGRRTLKGGKQKRQGNKSNAQVPWEE